MADRNKLQQTISKTQHRASTPSEEAERISFGRIVSIDIDTQQVEVEIFKGKGRKGFENIGFHPILGGKSAIEDVINRFGALQAGMGCIVFWRGYLTPQQGRTFITIISKQMERGSEDMVKVDPVSNEAATGPYRIFSGGLGL